MATYYHYTNSESLVNIVKEELLRSSEGSGLSSDAANSVFFTEEVILNELKKHGCFVLFWHVDKFLVL